MRSSVFSTILTSPPWTTTTSRGPTTTRICSTLPKVPTSQRPNRFRWSPASTSMLRLGRIGMTISAGRQCTRKKIPTSKASRRNSGTNSSQPSGWCPSGALYKRGEDGIVLIDQKRCRGWRACVAACPYKKTFYNWSTGKSEKCILCFPRLETGQAPACFHSCVGRIRYLGAILYDAERIEAIAKRPNEELVEAHRSMILDPFDPAVIAAARRCGVHDSVIQAAQKSPVYQFVKVWKLALPPH